MQNDNLDYNELKKRGFLKPRHPGFVTLRTSMLFGNYSFAQLSALGRIAEKYAQGYTHLTVRQGIEIPFIRIEDIELVEKELKEANIRPGTSGPRLRPITACPGSNWCKQGLIDTFGLVKRLEQSGIYCGMELPHKLKIALSGCPNSCTRVQFSDIGVFGKAQTSGLERKMGFGVFAGGCGGRDFRIGFEIDKIFSEDGVVLFIEKVIDFYLNNGKPRQRLGVLIENFGKNKFLEKVL
ncbi:MAG: hypothetical protein HY810_03440 [Candidatus Omnitrophica bacterium]|nr:hypothetical protein [Candidatus Omnitrophota bacterium]